MHRLLRYFVGIFVFRLRAKCSYCILKKIKGPQTKLVLYNLWAWTLISTRLCILLQNGLLQRIGIIILRTGAQPVGYCNLVCRCLRGSGRREEVLWCTKVIISTLKNRNFASRLIAVSLGHAPSCIGNFPSIPHRGWRNFNIYSVFGAK